jgi:hypothetical protein
LFTILVADKEVVQLYVQERCAKVMRPEKRVEGLHQIRFGTVGQTVTSSSTGALLPFTTIPRTAGW